MINQDHKLAHGLTLRSVLDALAAVAMIAASAAIIWATFGKTPTDIPAEPPAPIPERPVALAGAALKGSPAARIVAIAYADFECPYCAMFANSTLPALIEKYVVTGKLLVAFRHLPLERIHHSALRAAEAAECAGRQDRFWEMHDALFRSPVRLDDASLRAGAATLGLDADRFSACLGGETIEKIRREAEAARAIQVTGTPSFLLGIRLADGRVKVRRRASGSVPLPTFARMIDDLLRELDPSH